MKIKSLNKMYKMLTESVVKEPLNSNDKFVRPEPEQKLEQNHEKTSKIFIQKVLDHNF